MPAHKPMIEIKTYAELSSVRRRNSGLKIAAKGLAIFFARAFQRSGSFTLYMMNPISSAGAPPSMNMGRQPCVSPMK